jgi:hypothetical protein
MKLKMLVMRFATWSTINLPGLIPILDRVLHPFGICIGS